MSVTSRAKEFWTYFLEVEKQIKDALVAQDFATLNPLAEQLDDMCMQLFGSHCFAENTTDIFELTFDTGPNKTSQYLAWYVCQQAPESIKKAWILHSMLPPLSTKAVQAQLQIKEDVYSLNDFTVFYEIQEKNQTIDAKLYCPGYSLIKNGERKREMSMYLIELALGQSVYEIYLSNVDFLDAPIESKNVCNLLDFYDRIEQIVVDNHWKVYKSSLDYYSIFQPFQDFASDSLRKDMKYIFTTHPSLIEETIEGKKDVLLDLSSKEGEFGYLYYSNLFHEKEDALLRQEVSQKIDQILQEQGVARVIGGAIGKSYSYIDLIVFDPDRFNKVLASIKKQLTHLQLYYQAFEA